jgi:hypothetical protein
MTSVRNTFGALLLATLSFLAFAAAAATATTTICTPGAGAGNCQEPAGLALDFETGRLFVADKENNRIDVFDSEGHFAKAFGWGVKNGGSEFQVCTTSCRAGLPGSGQGQFKLPSAIAVDNDPASPSFHDVYVSDYANNRVEKLGPEGEFKLAFGSAGEGEGQLSSKSRIQLDTGPGGSVYVADLVEVAGNKWARLQRFKEDGTILAPQELLREKGEVEGFAVNSVGDSYIGSGPTIYEYEASGGAAIAELPASPIGLHALTVDSADDLFASTAEPGVGARSDITEYDSAGNILRRFGYDSLERWAVGLAPTKAGGSVYAGESLGPESNLASRIVRIDFPPPGPLVFPQPCDAAPIGNAKATLNAEVNPEGKATTYRFEYVDEESFEKKGGFASPKTVKTPETAVGEDFTLHKASAEVDVVPETEYRCRVIATNADEPAGAIGPEGKFTSKPSLEITEPIWASNVGTEAVTLNAALNPLGLPASGFFEYVDQAAFQASGFATARKAPAEGELEFGAGEVPVLRSTLLGGLAPGATYRYRLVATDAKIAPKTIDSGIQAFRTFRTGENSLPDGRGYELVSPAQKNSAEVGVPSVAGGVYLQEGSVRIEAAATNGEAITYTSWTSFGDAQSAPSTSQYLSRRTPGGWGTENINPHGFLYNALLPPYVGFTPNLGFGAFTTNEPPLGEAQKGIQNLYLRDSATGEVQALTVEEPQLAPGQSFCPGYAGSSADGQHAIFAGSGAMAGASVGEGFSLYEWSAGKGLELISVFPDGTPAPPVPSPGNPGVGTGFGAMGGNCKMGQSIVRHAISDDGSTIVWSYGGKYLQSEDPLFARIGGETVQLDAKAAGEKNGGKGRFLAATGDGSAVFFTAPGKLTNGAGKNQLYRYDTVERQAKSLIPGTTDPQLKGMVGISEDGNYAYFVAGAILSGEEENQSGQKTTEGANNLYLWHEGEGVRFIARLSNLDEGDWESAPERLDSRVTPDGRHLAFHTIEAEALSGYGNEIVDQAESGCQPIPTGELIGDRHCPEVYLYDATANKLTCASCNPSGARPTGPSELPSWTNPYEGPRVLSDDGSKLFFESRDALSGADENEKRDVYEFEQAGTGSCDTQSPGYVLASGGCVSLISSGRSEDETYLLDATADGRDVFLTTRSRLTGWDANENYDVYDAREGGGFPEPPPIPKVCEGEGCLLAVPPAPAAPAPSTPAFAGPGNAKPKPRKAKRKHRTHKKKHRRAGHSGRAGR